MAAATKKDVDELRAKIVSLEQDIEILMTMKRNMANIFSLGDDNDDDKRQEYKKGEFKTIDVILRNIAKGNLVSAHHLANIEKLSNETVYSNASWFRSNLVTEFGKLYFKVNKTPCHWELSFNEVKGYIKELSEFKEKFEIQAFVSKLKSAAK
jgi:hypothetical protein